MDAPRRGNGPSRNNVPERLDRLPWSRWHVMVAIALVTWLLDGLEGMLVGSPAGILKRPDTLAVSDATIGPFPGTWPASPSFALTGAGVGGEYATINSAVDEIIPACVRVTSTC